MVGSLGARQQQEAVLCVDFKQEVWEISSGAENRGWEEQTLAASEGRRFPFG